MPSAHLCLMQPKVLSVERCLRSITKCDCQVFKARHNMNESKKNLSVLNEIWASNERLLPSSRPLQRNTDAFRLEFGCRKYFDFLYLFIVLVLI